MPGSKMIGIDFGNFGVRFCLCEGYTAKQFVCERLPDNIVQNGSVVSWDAMGDTLRSAMKSHGLRGRNIAFSLPESSVNIQRVSLPLMSEQQLKVNLPYEFHDYINEDMDKYIYDYAVNKIDDESMELLAVACRGDVVENYVTMSRRAGLNLKILAPDIVGFRNILRRYEHVSGAESGVQDYAILDLGDRTLKFHFFTRGEYEITRILEPGCRAVTEAMAEASGHEIHIVSEAALSGSLGEEKMDTPELREIYSAMAVEVMRVLNFYRYSNPAANLECIHYCGGGANIPALIDEISRSADVPLRPLTDLIECSEELRKEMISGPLAYGIAIGNMR